MQKTESEVGIYISGSAQLIPKAAAKATRISAKQKKKQAEEPLYLKRM